MSSSDGSPRGFAMALGITFAVMSLAFAAAALLLDPMGATSGNRLCASGIKADIRLNAKRSSRAGMRRPRSCSAIRVWTTASTASPSPA